MKAVSLTVAALTLALCGAAQTKWINPLEAGYYTVQNQAWPEEIGKSYVRLPDRAEKDVRKPLWDLSRNSAGLSLYFVTDAPRITVRYTIDGPLAMHHMPATGVSGVDLYRQDANGTEEYCFGGYAFNDTVSYSYNNLPAGEAEYHLNLPLFNTVKWLEIGVPEGSSFKLLERNADKPVVVYGTWIAHGACSSRPGMAWVNIMRRQLGNEPVVNLGFSGNGRLEPEMISLINEIDAQLYILDCMPNLTTRSEQEVYDLVMAAVKQIRAEHPTPILLVEHAGYSNAPTNASQLELYTRLNAGQRRAFEQLQAEGTPNLYYITHDEIAMPADGWVDYVHPSDLGAQRQADVVSSRVHAILNK